MRSCHKRTKQCKSSECRGRNCKAFTYSGSCVSNGIQFISSLTNFSWQFRHFGNTTGIVRNWTVCINSKLNSKVRKHTYCSDSNTVQSPEFKCTDDRNSYNDDGDSG